MPPGEDEDDEEGDRGEDDAGRFDGCLGVLTGIAVVAELEARQVVHPFAIEVIAFGDEEGVRFASALGGSRALAGSFDPAILDERDEHRLDTGDGGSGP